MDTTLGYLGYAQSEFEGLQEYVFKPNAGVFPEDVYNAESFLWAFGILRSRTFDPFVGEQIALVPGLDLINHTDYGIAIWQRKVGGLFGGEPTAALVSANAAVAGEQVCPVPASRAHSLAGVRIVRSDRETDAPILSRPNFAPGVHELRGQDQLAAPTRLRVRGHKRASHGGETQRATRGGHMHAPTSCFRLCVSLSA